MVLKWLSSLFAPDDRLGRVSFPSDAYAAPVDAISALMDVEGAAKAAQGQARIIGYYDEISGQAITRLGRVS